MLTAEVKSNGSIWVYRGEPKRASALLIQIRANNIKLWSAGYDFSDKMAINHVAIQYNLGFQIISIPGPGTWKVAILCAPPNSEFRFDKDTAIPYYYGMQIARPSFAFVQEVSPCIK